MYRMLLVVFGLFFCSYSCVVGQVAPSIEWQRSLGGSGNDEAYAIDSTGDGGYVIAGGSASNDGDVLKAKTDVDAWIIKMNKAGNVLWKKSYGGSGYDDARSIQHTKDGGYIVAGLTSSTDGDVGVHLGGFWDGWVFKLDANGNIQWTKVLGGKGDDEPACIRETRDGGFIMAGQSNSTDKDGLGNHGSVDYWVVKMDGAGNIMWTRSLGGTAYDAAYYVQQTSDDGYILAGTSSSMDKDVHKNFGTSDYWIVKLDAGGSIVWENSYGGSDPDYANSIQQTNDGGYVVGGFSYSVDGDVHNHHGDNSNGDFWIVKLSVSGSIVWETSLGGLRDDEAVKIIQTIDSGYAALGYSASSDGDVTTNHGEEDVWIVKLNDLGKLQWQKSLGGSYSERGNDFLQTNDDEFVTIAWTQSKDGDVIGHHGDSSTYDYWIVKLAFIPQISSLQQQTFANLLCGASTDDTIWIHNVGTGTLLLDSVMFPPGTQLFSLLPHVFPDSLAPGDSTLLIFRFATSTVGTYTTTVNIYSNDTAAARHPWPITFTGRKDSVEIGVSVVRGDTVDFGYLSCGAAKDSAITLENNSTVATTVTVQSSNASMFTLAPSAYLNFGAQQSLPVHFNGEGLPGTYTSTLTITDTCGRIHNVTLVAHVDSAVFAMLAAADTMICPGDSVIRLTTIRNSSRADQTVQLSTTNPQCSVTPSSTVISPGASMEVEVVFHGTVTSGVYPVAYTITDACGGVQTTTMTVRVSAPAITVPASFTVTVCPFTPVKVELPVTNVDTVTRSLAYASTTCTLAHANSTLRPGEMDSLLVTYPGGAAGTYPCVVHIVDECGITHDVTMTVNVQIPPALALTPSTDPVAAAIGKIEKKIYIIATPATAISGSDITFTVVNEATALQFDSATSKCGIRVVSGMNAATITISGCPTPTSDTLATLFYQPLVGSTLAPWVRVLNVSTTNACQSITGSGTAAISLLPPGCELGTVLVHPFTSALQSVYPNPATGATTINYSTIENANLTIELFDALGRRTNMLVNAEHQPGKYSVMLDASALTTGVYCIMLREGKYLDKRELVVGR